MQAVNSAFDCFHAPKFCEYIDLTCKEYVHIKSIDVSKVIGVEEAPPKGEKPPSGITFIHLGGEVRTVGYSREFFEYKVQILCHTNEFGFNILFYIGMITSKNIKSVQYIDVELLQKYPIELTTIPHDIGSKPRFRLTEE